MCVVYGVRRDLDHERVPDESAFAELFNVIRLRVREARKAAGLNQEHASERAGIDVRVWQRFETRQPRTADARLLTLYKIAKGLDLDMCYLVREPSKAELQAVRDWLS
jgi:transcriptional regulator with XRE-family HTH domain